MPPEVQEEPEEGAGALPRRDWILLPALGLLTVVAILGFSDLFARTVFAGDEARLASCLVLNDSTTGVRGVPNCRCMAKSSESDWVEYKFNRCGHRDNKDCATKPPGIYRIVMAGSSIAMGLLVPADRSIAGLLPREISRATGRDVELYNTSIGAAFGGTPRNVLLRFNEIQAAKPDLILWLLTPWDIEHAGVLRPPEDFVNARNGMEAQSVPLNGRVAAVIRLAGRIGAAPLAAALYRSVGDSRFRFLLTHYLYESQSLYVGSFLKNQDENAGFLKSQWTPAWNGIFHEFEGYAAQIVARAGQLNVPISVVLVPSRAQAAMVSMGDWPQGYDPYELDKRLKDFFTRQGAVYLEISPQFRGIPNPEQHYVPLDGHPDAEGHAIIAAMISREISREITSGVIPALRAPASNSAETAAK